MSVYDWSTTAANNDVADATVNWAEDQAPSTVNNSARAMMAALAKFVKDTGGAITSTGSANAYVITTNSALTAHTVPVLIAFKANFTSSGASTVTIDGLAVKPLKRSNGAAIQSGDIVSGSIYLIAYQSASDVYLCLNIAGNYDPTAVAITGGTIDGVVITATNTGLHVLDIDASHDLILKPGSNLTADRTLTITTADADRTLTLGGNATLNGGTVSSGTHSGTNTGDQTITLTGDVTGSGTTSFAATIANDAVTNAKAANMAQSTIKGRAVSAGTGDPTDLTATQATAVLDAVVGDSGSGGTKGLVPAPSSGDAAANKFLKASGAWVAVTGGLTNIQVFTSGGTYTPTSGASKAIVFVTGGGGGGGGASGTGAGAGGSAAATALAYVSSVSSQTVTIGAGGGEETAGGQSAFGSITADGGAAGTRGSGSGGSGVAGTSTTSGATLAIPGGGSGAGTPDGNHSGMGGASFWGGGAPDNYSTGAASGIAAVAYGAGGSGAIRHGSSSPSGGAGKSGVVVILEF